MMERLNAMDLLLDIASYIGVLSLLSLALFGFTYVILNGAP